MELNPHALSVNPSATLGVTMRAKELRAQGVHVISLAAGEPDFPTPAHIIDAAITALKEGKTTYTPSRGIPELRKAISEKFARENTLSYPPEQVVVSCGAKHSLYVVCRLILRPHDEVIIPAPYWVSYPEFVRMNGANPVYITTTEEARFLLTPAQLADAISPRTRAVFLNSPSNPTGTAYDKKSLENIADVLRKTPHVIIIADEIYERLTYPPFTHHSLAAIAPDLYPRIFTVNGFSKAFSMTGWRLGYTGCPDAETANVMARLQDHSTSGMTSFAQYGGIAALTAGDACVEEMRHAFAERRTAIVRLLKELPGVTCVEPDGAFYVFPCVKAWNIPSAELAMRLLEEAHVAVVPGSAFGCEGHLRLSYAIAQKDIEEAISRIHTWVKEHVG